MSNLDASDDNIEIFGSILFLVNVATYIYTCTADVNTSLRREKSFFIFYTYVHLSEMAIKLVNF